jgi:hypothetical protein
VLSNNAEVQSMADWNVAVYGNPEYRFDNVTVNLNSLTGSQQTTLLNMELGDLVRVVFTPNKVGSPIDKTAQIIHIEQRMTTDSHYITYGLSALDFNLLVMDDTAFGILDLDVLGM